MKKLEILNKQLKRYADIYPYKRAIYEELPKEKCKYILCRRLSKKQLKNLKEIVIHDWGNGIFEFQFTALNPQKFRRCQNMYCCWPVNIWHGFFVKVENGELLFANTLREVKQL